MFTLPLIDINVTNFCNYSCPYCKGRYSNNIEKYFMNLTNTIKLINRILINHVIEKIIICGNCEPTLHPKLYQFLKQLTVNKTSIELYSNLSANENLYKNILNIENINLVASYHNINNNLNIQFFKKLKSLKNEFLNHIYCDILIEPNIVTQSLLAYKMIKSILGANRCSISLVDNYDMIYSNNDIKHINEVFNFEKLTTHTYNNTINKILYINYDGKIKYASYRYLFH